MQYTTYDIATIVGGRVIGKDNIVTDIIFDSRSVFSPLGKMFVALSGELSNGHNYIPQLIERGVVTFMVSEEYISSNMLLWDEDTISYIVVSDTLWALQELARHHRKSVISPIVAVTGSNGKSVIKEWLHQLYSSDISIYRSPKSYNSQLGVALSLLLIPDRVDMCVIEAGISKPNEMNRLQQMIEPDVVILTNIGDAHSENFSSSDEILIEKLSLAGNSDKIIIRRELADRLPDDIDRNKLFIWGDGGDVDLKFSFEDNNTLLFNYDDSHYSVEIPYNDLASLENTLHIISLSAYLGMDLNMICGRIKFLSPVAMRLEIIDGVNDTLIINDCYNSDFNSLSVALAHLSTLSTVSGRCVILSDIIGSGRDNEELYSDVARLLNSCNIDMIVAVGECVGDYLASKVAGQLIKYRSTEEFLDNLNPKIFSNHSLLIKGCRRFGFERIAELLQQKQHKSVIEVNIDSLIHNYRYFKSIMSDDVKMVAMVKAMAYGSGYYEVALALQNSGVDYLAVAYLDEGVTLRERGITTPIIILNSNPCDYASMIEFRLEPEIYSIYSLNRFIDICKRVGEVNYPIHIKLDTGMHRMGFEFESLDELKDVIDNSDDVNVVSIFSHFSSSDDPTLDEITYSQIEKFRLMCEKLNYPLAIRHICNSCGVVRFPEAHFEMVRVGLGLYGVLSCVQDKLRCVSSLHTSILQIKSIKKGEYVGYNQSQVAECDMTIATLSIGYADGFDRRLGGGKWCVKINGKSAPTFGNISMDTCAIDITGIDAKEGDKVTIFGDYNDIESMADCLDTIPYEILTSISTRIKRVYIRE